MLKERETEETIAFLVTFLSLAAIQLEGPGPPVPPLATPISRPPVCDTFELQYTSLLNTDLPI